MLADDYTKSDSKKAQEKGEKATTIIGKSGKNKGEMFRFNPGKEKKIFPPKNAYTAKHCKGGKVDMSRLIGMSAMVLSLEDDKCKVQKMLEEEAKKRQIKDGNINVKDWMKKNIPADIGLKIETKVPFLEKSYLFRSSIGKILSAGHDFPLEKFELIKNLKTQLKEAKYIGWAEDEEINGVKKHRDVDYWKYFEIEYLGVKSFICVKKTLENINKLYSIEDTNGFKKIKGIKKESPKR